MRNNERGSILVISVLLLALVVGVIALVINSSYARFVRSELKAAADAAAHGGGKQICSSLTCWDNAKKSAIDILSAHTAHGDLADDLNLTVPLSEGPVWDYTEERNLVVTIERGRYTLSEGFESLESEEWLAANPGTPRHIVFNAIRVRILRPAVEIMGTTFASTLWSISSESTVIAAPVEPVCVVPFAIPICQLLNPKLELSSVCQQDTIFAAADKYCRNPAEHCDVRPSFSYAICHPEAEKKLSHRLEFSTGDEFLRYLDSEVPATGGYQALWSHWQPVQEGGYCFTSHGTPFLGSEDCSTGNSDGWYVDQGNVSLSDHYGVVGLPYDHPISEGDVMEVLSADAGCVTAEIGDRFSVLQEGLTTREMEDLIWRRIADLIDPTPDAKHPSFRTAGLGTIERNASFFVWNNDISCSPLRRERGLCASRRFQPDFSNTADSPFPYLPFKAAPGISDATPVWEVRVPVIANTSPEAAACESEAGGTVDPPVIDADQFEIVGFVKVHLFDVSIGSVSPGMPESPQGLESAGAWGFGVENSFGDIQGECNLVRGRLSCDNRQLIPTSNPGEIRPMFIEKSLTAGAANEAAPGGGSPDPIP